MRWSASANNEQPWRFLVGVRGSTTHHKIFESLVGFNKGWAGAAPVLILGVASTSFTHNSTPNAYAFYDLGAAAAVLSLQAAALGISTHSMAGFDQTIARQLLQIPEEFVLGAVIALGYQGEPVALGNEQMIAREIAPRTRKQLSEFVLSSWGTPADLS